jgi:hypothetical protein
MPDLLLCADVIELLACAIERRDEASAVPILQAPDDLESVTLDRFQGGPFHAHLRALGDPARVVAAAAERINRLEEPKGRLCVIVEGDEMQALGAAHAALARRRIVSIRSAMDLGPLLAAELVRSLVIVASADWFSNVGFEEIRLALSEAGFGTPPMWGILTGSTAPALSRLIARTALRVPASVPEAALVFWGERTRLRLPKDARVRTQDLSSARPEDLDESRRRPLPLAIVTGHGRDYCALEGNLCTRPGPEDRESMACLAGLECSKPGWPRRSVAALPYATVVLEVCEAGKLQGSFVPNVNIALRFLESHAVTVLAPFRPVPLTQIVSPIVWKLARTGRCMGEIACHVNAAISIVHGLASPYILFGDPDQVVFDVASISAPNGAPAPVDMTVSRLDADRWRIAIPRSFEPQPAGDFWFGPPLGPAGDERPLYLCQAPTWWEDGDNRALLLSNARGCVLGVDAPGQPADQAPLELEFTTRAPFDLELLSEASNLLDCIALEGSLVGTDLVKEMRARLDGHAGAVMVSGERPIPLTGSYRRLVALRDGMACLVGALRREVLRRWASRLDSAHGDLAQCMENTVNVPLFYGKQRAVRRRCPLCGGGVLIEYDYHLSYREGSRRTRYQCERCRDLCDVPAGEPMVVLRMPRVLRRGEPVVVELEGESSVDRKREIEACLVFAHADAGGVVAVLPSTMTVRVEARGRFVAAFTVRPDETLRKHAFALRALALVGGRLFWASAPFMVHEAVGGRDDLAAGAD